MNAQNLKVVPFTLSLLVWLSLLAAQAQRLTDVPPQDQTAVQAVIQAQINAFKKDDALTAYSFAAPGIKQMFGSPEVFIEMVRRGYGPIYRPLKLEFGKASRTATGIMQTVKIVGLDGKKILAYYLMERQGDGSWKIAGVQTEDAPEEGTT
ncbi:MAG: DUF4864 domain-containing protein [Meiothermus sp.]